MAWSDLAKLAQSSVLGAFAEDVTFTADGGQPVVVRGVFRTPHVEVNLASGIGVSSTRPCVDVRLADLPVVPVAHACTVTARGNTYSVNDVQDDGEGLVTLVLTAYQRAD